jgi:transposase
MIHFIISNRRRRSCGADLRIRVACFRTSRPISVCQRTIRCSIPPEQLLSALLLQVFWGVRSERQLMGQLDYNLSYRWFVGPSPDDRVWDPTTFNKNRERPQNCDVFTKFMTRLLNHSQFKPLLSDEHFSVDGTLIEAWASQKSFRASDGSDDVDDGANFHGQKRKNDEFDLIRHLCG